MQQDCQISDCSKMDAEVASVGMSAESFWDNVDDKHEEIAINIEKPIVPEVERQPCSID